MYLTMSFLPNFVGLLLLYIPLHICTIHRLSVPTLASRLTSITSQSSFDSSIIFAHASPPVLELVEFGSLASCTCLLSIIYVPFPYYYCIS